MENKFAPMDRSDFLTDQDVLDSLNHDQLLEFFRRNRKLMSGMEHPQTFLNQLRVHELIPEEMYQKLNGMKSKELRQNGLYQMLNWLEEKGFDCIQLFWRCVFRDHLLQQYPTLFQLRRSLLGAKDKEMPPCAFTEEKDEEQPSTSTRTTATKMKNVQEPVFSSLKKGETAGIWTWPKYKTQLPITCGDKKATLYRDKMARGEDCIQAGDQWFTPSGFEEFGGTISRKNWKTSIRCKGTTLEKLIQEGILTSPGLKRRDVRKRGRFPSNQSVSSTDSEHDHQGEDDEEEEAKWEAGERGEQLTPSGGRSSLGRSFPGSSSPGRSSPGKSTPGRSCPGRSSPGRSSPGRSCPGRSSPGRSSPGRSCPGRSSPGRSTPIRSSPGRSCPGRSSPGRSTPGRSCPIRSLVVPRKDLFHVICGVASGMLNKKRFASGTRGKCIRTEQSWMTPEEFLSEGSNMTESSWTKDILWDGKPLSVLIKNKFLKIHTLLCKCLNCNPTAEDLQDQENDDNCFICRSPGSLICCEECPRSFHPGCHLPNVDGAMLGNDLPWVCTFCIMRHSQSWRFPSKNTYQEVLNYQTSDRLLECQYLLLYLYNADKDHIFVKDPRTNVRKYSSVIKNLMWLDEVARKLQDGQYQTLKPFVSDLLLIFTNCATFNRENSKFREMGERLKEQFEREFKKTFSCSDPMEFTSYS